MITAARNCVVLDTNVCLDLFVFRDPRWAALLADIESGRTRAVTRSECRDEYRAVLLYPHLKLDDAGREQALARFDALLERVDAPARPIRLPVCSDRDDQKFLELARDVGADVLITKDKALLKLARKTAQAGLFRILLPEAWLALG
jgi:putative PIN family toxin of toxin-antitoxin system